MLKSAIHCIVVLGISCDNCMTKWGGNQVLNKMNVELFINTFLITSE